MDTWVDKELAGCSFKDVRLDHRFRKLVGSLSRSVGESIPLACQDRANTKAAYRFFSNAGVTEEEILEGHFQATRSRVDATPGPILVLHDTTTFSYRREDPADIGITHKSDTGIRRKDYPQYRIECGIHMHSSLVLTPEGLPLGVAAIKFFTRKKFKGSRALKRDGMNSSHLAIRHKESIRWLENLKHATELLGAPDRCVHIGDREGDIYEFFTSATEANTHFLVRVCNDRQTAQGRSHRISDEMRKQPVKVLHRLRVKDKKGEDTEAVLEIRYQRIRIRPPEGKRSFCPDLDLTVIYAQEKEKPKNRDRIDWKLITDLPVDQPESAIQKLDWYAMRWKIETWHKILKSGCRAEESKLRSAERLSRLISVFCIISWRIFWLTMINRISYRVPPEVAFTKAETQILDRLVPSKMGACGRWRKNDLRAYTSKLAQLGGYLARANDPPPGNKVMWKGLIRLIDIEIGFTMALKLVGN